jgi:hypothetical protein
MYTFLELVITNLHGPKLGDQATADRALIIPQPLSTQGVLHQLIPPDLVSV